MSYVTKVFKENLEKYAALLGRLPDNTYFSVPFGSQERELELQAGTQAEVRAVRRALGGLWKKQWRKECNWWEYTTCWAGVQVRLYGVTEKPATCTPIMAKKEVTVREATGWVDKVVEKEVIVGWDCGPSVEEEDAREAVVDDASDA